MIAPSAARVAASYFKDFRLEQAGSVSRLYCPTCQDDKKFTLGHLFPLSGSGRPQYVV